MLDGDSLDAFRAAYKEATGLEISSEEAEPMARKVLELVRILCRTPN